MTKWERTERVFRSIQHDPDMDAIRVVYAAAAAHYLPGVPVWAFDIAPPSSGKTERLLPLRKVRAHIISNVTPQTFISGWTWRKAGEKSRDASLLTRIGSGILVCKDFSQVLSMPKKTRAPILADLRDIYDGYISKPFGTGETKEWSGRITFLAGATPDIDLHYSIYQTLGERFIQVRSRRPGGVEAAMLAMQQNPKQNRELLATAVFELLNPIFSTTHPNPEIYRDDLLRIASLAEFTVCARTHVPRDGRSREIIYMPEAEASPRLAQQFAQLARGSALLDHREQVNATDLALVKRVAFDSIRADRRAILDYLRSASEARPIGWIADKVHIPQPTVSRRIEELSGLGLVDSKPSDVTGEESFAGLSELARSLLDGASSYSEKVPLGTPEAGLNKTHTPSIALSRNTDAVPDSSDDAAEETRS